MDLLRRYFHLLLMIVLLTVLANTGLVQAESDPMNDSLTPLEHLESLEKNLIGQPARGGLVDRLGSMEELMVGRLREGSLNERLGYLETLIYTNQPHDISLLYKLQALEWVLYRSETDAPFIVRLENLEKTVFGTVYSGAVTKRLERLIVQVFPEGTVKGHWLSVPEGLLFKVRVLNELSSVKNYPGDSFQFQTTDTLSFNGLVIFPKGVIGKGVLKEIRHPDNLGRDAQLMLDFIELRALDTTPVPVFYGSKALAMDKSRRLAVGASAAGMMAFGPGGILLGLMVKGKETVIPKGTEFYLQVREPVRIYTMER